MLSCPSCGDDRITGDPFTGIYLCRNCSYQGTLVVQKDEE